MPSDAENGATSGGDAAAMLMDGQPLQTARDVSAFFGVNHNHMMWMLFKAPPAARYRTFEIPKRTGGMRLISSPNGLVRDLQTRLAPLLAAAYELHPASHGFLEGRSILTNAREHAGQRQVLNIDLEDFFPSINFGRVRGLFMARPFHMGPGAATVLARIVSHRNGLPQGAPTSPALSNFIAAALDRRLMRLAKENRLRYTRYADDITFSTNQPVFPPAIAYTDAATGRVAPAEALQRAVAASGFAINARKVRLQTRHQRQNVTGLVVNASANVQRGRIRKLRAMLHAWEKFGLAKAAAEHFIVYRGGVETLPADPSRAFRNMVYGQLAFIKMVRGPEDAVFLNLCARLIDLDPNPSRFIRQMVFGADDFDVFISHASEDKETIARPIYEACARAGLKAFLDQAHIGWGQDFTQKINTALGAARTVLCVVSQNAVTKEWPLAEINTALGMEVIGHKRVAPLIVGKPDLSKLPLLRGRDHLVWKGDPEAVARALIKLARPAPGGAPRAAVTSLPTTPPEPPPNPPPPAEKKKGWSLFGLFRKKRD